MVAVRDAQGRLRHYVSMFSDISAEKFAEAQERFPFLRGYRDVVVSAQERLLKPDPAIYRLLLAAVTVAWLTARRG